MSAEDPGGSPLWEIPFSDAFEDDTGTYPFGTLSKTASHVTTLPSTTDAALALSSTAAESIFVDLGCGVGRVANRARETTDCTTLGIDMCKNEISQAVSAAAGNGAAYVVGDVFDSQRIIEELPGFDKGKWRQVVVFTFLIPTLMNSPKFQALLEGFMEKGAVVVSYVPASR
jgi:SAM-dependent methyltransferase